MATEKQIQANQSNAQLSTGPRTPEGKRRVALNAFKHGFYSNTPLLEGEDAEAWQELYDSVIEEFSPQGVLELELASRIVFNLWQLRRLARIENNLLETGVLSTRKAIHGSWNPDPVLKRLETDGLRAEWFRRDVSSGHPAWENLQRHRMRFERSYYKALHELERRVQARAALETSSKQTASPKNGFVPSKRSPVALNPLQNRPKAPHLPPATPHPDRRMDAAARRAPSRR